MTNTMTTTSCPVADHKLAVDGMKVERHYCCMGQDYDCGCNFCSNYAYAKAVDVANAWDLSTAAHRASVAAVTGALECLAIIGRIMALVASMPTAIRQFAVDAATLYHHTATKGARYKVTGKAGAAKLHHGVEGVCKWIGESEYNARPAGWRGTWNGTSKVTVRIGLAVEGQAKLVYVPFGQCERITAAPDDLAAEIAAQLERKIVAVTIAEAGVRPRWTGKLPAGRKTKKNPAPMAYVVSGRDQGASGTVFWLGADKRTGEADARLGIRCENGTTVWASAYDCRNTPPTGTAPTSADERTLIERIAADAVMADKPELARKLLAQVVR